MSTTHGRSSFGGRRDGQSASQTGRVLELKHCFGFRSEVRQPLFFRSEDQIIYTCGNNVIIHNTTAKSQVFVSDRLSSNGDSRKLYAVTAVDMHLSRGIIVVAEKLVISDSAQSEGMMDPNSTSSAGSGGVNGSGFNSSSSMGATGNSEFGSNHSSNLGNTSNGDNVGHPLGRAPIISVYEVVSDRKIKRRRVIDLNEHTKSLCCTEILSLKLSADSKMFLAVTNGPDWCVANFQREKGRLYQVTRLPLTVNPATLLSPLELCLQASYCPSDPTLVVVSGLKLLRFFRLEQNEFKAVTFSVGKREPCAYTCHTWDGARQLLVATDHGEVLHFEQTDFRGIVETQSSAHIRSLASHSKGFLCGCDNGQLLVMERTMNERDMYRVINTLTVQPRSEHIIHLAISPAQETLLCITADSQVYSVSLQQIEVLKDNNNGLDNGSESNFVPFLTPFHSGKINGLDLCIRKPHLVTCGTDKTVRIWNWLDKTLVMKTSFTEEPLSVTIHPSGLHLVCGFSDKLRLINVLMDDLRICKEIPIKGCSQVKYSNGGHLFAVVNSSAIQIYATYTYENVCGFRGHTGRINSIWWSPDDSFLVSAGDDNSVLLWNILTHTKVNEHSNKGCLYKSAVRCINDRTYGIGSDHTLKVIAEIGTVERTLKLGDDCTPLNSLCIAKSSPQHWIYASTEGGTIMALNILELTAPNLPAQVNEVLFQELSVHNGSISRMRMSYDDSMLVTVGSDGGICIFEIDELAVSSKHSIVPSQSSQKEKTGSQRTNNPTTSLLASPTSASATGSGSVTSLNSSKVTNRSKKKELQVTFAEEILVSKEGLENKLKEIARLSARVEELKKHTEYEVRMKQLSHEEKMRQLNDRYEKEVSLHKLEYRRLQDESDEMRDKYQITLNKLKSKHKDKVNDVKKYHQSKINTELNRYESLTLKLQSLRLEWNNDKLKREHDYNDELITLKQELNEKINQDQIKIKNSEQEYQKINHEFYLVKKIFNQEINQEINQLKLNFESVLKKERTQTLELRGNNGMLKREYATLQQRRQTGKDKLKTSMEEQNKLIDEIKRLEKDIESYERELNERQITIMDKNKMITDVTSKNQSLEKFKFVLDYKIKQLDKQIRPKEIKINELNLLIESYKKKILEQNELNKLLKLKLADVTLKHRGLMKEQSKTELMNKTLMNIAETMRMELSDIKKQMNHHSLLRKSIKQLHMRFKDVNLDELITKSLGNGSSNQNNNNNKKRKKKKKDENNHSNKEEENKMNQSAHQILTAGLGIHADFQRHRLYLENTIQSLQNKLIKDDEIFQSQKKKILEEHRLLLKEKEDLNKQIELAQKINSEKSSKASIHLQNVEV